MTSTEIIAACSLIVALCALFATVWQAHIARKHNMISVRPSLLRTEQKEFNDAGATISFVLTNVGGGPALITEKYFTYAGDRFETREKGEHLVKAMVEQLLGTKYPYRLRHFGLPGDVVASGERIVLATVEFPTCSDSGLAQILASLPDYSLCIRYRSVYDEEFEL